MNGFSKFKVALSLTLGLVVSYVGYAADAPQAPSDTRMAVVDVSKVFTNFKKVFDVQQQVDASFAAQRTEIQNLELDMKKQGEYLRQLHEAGKGEESEMVLDAAIKYQRTEWTYRNAMKKLQKETDEMFYESMRDVLNEIRASIRKEALARGFSFVLRTPDSDDSLGLVEDPKNKNADKTEAQLREMLLPQSTFQLLSKFDKNPVMYGSQTVDITEAVLASLNKDYQKFLENKGGVTDPKGASAPKSVKP